MTALRQITGGVSGARAPGVLRDRRMGSSTLFVLVVLLPTLVAALFYGLVASDRYLSESRFLVRSASTQQAGGLASFLRTFGLARADDDAFSVQSYIASRDALRDLMETLPMREILNREGVDPVSRCLSPWSRDTFETLYGCYLSRVRILREDETGISRLTIDLFTPEDSFAVSRELLTLSERLANRMNDRAEEDALATATRVLADAEERVVETQREVTEFRNRELLIDIDGRSSESAEVIAGLVGDLVRTRATIAEQRRLSPSGPALDALEVRQSVLEEQIRLERGRLAGSDGSLASQAGTYETLMLQRSLADQALTLASNTLDHARQEARRQGIYIETIVRPNLADRSIRPQRLRNVLSVLMTTLLLFGIAWLLLVGSREHLNRHSQ